MLSMAGSAGHIEVAITQDLPVSSILVSWFIRKPLHLGRQTLVVPEEAHTSVEWQDAKKHVLVVHEVCH